MSKITISHLPPFLNLPLSPSLCGLITGLNWRYRGVVCCKYEARASVWTWKAVHKYIELLQVCTVCVCVRETESERARRTCVSLCYSTCTYNTASAGHEWASVRATLWREVKRAPLFSCERLTCRICVKLTSAVVSPLLSVSVELKKDKNNNKLCCVLHPLEFDLFYNSSYSDGYLWRYPGYSVSSVLEFISSPGLLTDQAGVHDGGAASVMYRRMITCMTERLLQPYTHSQIQTQVNIAPLIYQSVQFNHPNRLHTDKHYW